MGPPWGGGGGVVPYAPNYSGSSPPISILGNSILWLLFKAFTFNKL